VIIEDLRQGHGVTSRRMIRWIVFIEKGSSSPGGLQQTFILIHWLGVEADRKNQKQAGIEEKGWK